MSKPVPKNNTPVAMPFVVTQACINCKYTDCVDVCPMDCFFEGANFLAINPDECIDCSMCVPECPVGAIVGDHEVALDQQHFIALNTDLATRSDWRRITRSQAPLPDHAYWARIDNKLPLLDSAGASSKSDGNLTWRTAPAHP